MFSPSVLRKRLRGNLEELYALVDDLPNAEEEEERAVAALARARLRVLTLRRRLEFLKSDSKAITLELNTIATFPPELLSMVFAFANTQNDFYAREGDRFLRPYRVDHDRVALPWRLGLVCRHWREAVLASPAAWNYIGISYKLHPVFSPGAHGPYSSPLSSLYTCLEHSGSVPLHVVIASNGGDGRGERLDSDLMDDHGFFHPRFQVLQEHIHRIRSLHVYGVTLLQRDPRWYGSHVTMYRGLLDLLRAPMASLVELRIHMYAPKQNPPTSTDFWEGFPARPFPLLLPDAPKLRELSVEGAPVICRRPHPGLPSLKTLLYRLRSMFDVHLHDMLAIAPNLERLSLEVDEFLAVADPIPGGFQPAPQVKTLEIPSGQYFGLLADGARLLPNLSRLLLYDFDELVITPALARRLTRLDIVEQEDLHEHIGLLRQLTNVEHVEFGDNVTMRDDLFFAPFCDPDDPMWPKLRVIVFNAAELLSVDKDGVLAVLRARNFARDEGPARDGQVIPCPIEEIDAESLPEWVAMQVRAILPPCGQSDDA